MSMLVYGEAKVVALDASTGYLKLVVESTAGERFEFSLPNFAVGLVRRGDEVSLTKKGEGHYVFVDLESGINFVFDKVTNVPNP